MLLYIYGIFVLYFLLIRIIHVEGQTCGFLGNPDCGDYAAFTGGRHCCGPAGTYYVECSPGTYSPPGYPSMDCIYTTGSNPAGVDENCLCCPGTTADANGNINGYISSSCSAPLYCNPGEYNRIPAGGSCNCGTCAAGKYEPATGAEVCTDCTAGKYSATMAATAETACTVCAQAGKYTIDAGASNCLDCGQGKYKATVPVAAVTCGGTCGSGCSPFPVSGATSGTISKGTDDYIPSANCVWLITTTPPGVVIKLNFICLKKKKLPKESWSTLFSKALQEILVLNFILVLDFTVYPEKIKVY
jgi:hypothetical protein